MGAGLAANLGVAPGDIVVLLANTEAGSINAAEVQVRGLFSTASKAYDDSALRVPIEIARTLVRTDGTHAWVLLLNETERTDEVLERLRAQFPEEETNLQFVAWYELADFYNKTVVLFTRQMYILQLIISLIILLSISNTLVMSVLERTGEIGTLMAVGLSNRSGSRSLGVSSIGFFLLPGVGFPSRKIR